MHERLTEEQLTDIEIRARDMIAASAPESCECGTCEVARGSLVLITEIRALQRDLESHARDIAGLRLSKDQVREIVREELRGVLNEIAKEQMTYEAVEAEREACAQCADLLTVSDEECRRSALANVQSETANIIAKHIRKGYRG
jgi:hypothetical protein